MKMYQKGFTVVEVLITMVIIVVLASIAYPSYVSLLRKAHRAEAATELASLAQAQERYYARFRIYSSVVDAPGECAGSACGLKRSSSLSENDYYLLSARGDATSYTLTATAHGAQLEDTDCNTLTIDNVGIKSARSESGQDLTETCW
jgi:type IV pilus assembly protein PilE